jgi:hypothetical protein
LGGVVSIDIPCEICNERGSDQLGNPCQECDGQGYWSLTECPRRFVGPRFSQEINLASYATRGLLPLPGAMLDQPHWFFDLIRVLENETNKIEMKIRER